MILPNTFMQNISSASLFFAVLFCAFFVKPGKLTVYKERAHSYRDGGVIDYVTLPAGEGRSLETLKLSKSLTSRPVCCKTLRDTDDDDQWNSLQNEQKYREIETVGDLKTDLEHPKYLENGRKKHSINPTDYNNKNSRTALQGGISSINLILEHAKNSVTDRPDQYVILAKYNKSSKTNVYDTATTTVQPYWLKSQNSYTHQANRHTRRTTTTFRTETRKPSKPTTISPYYNLLPPSRRPPIVDESYPHNNFHSASENSDLPIVFLPTQNTRPPVYPQPLIEDEDGYPIFARPPTTTRRPHQGHRKRKLSISELKCKEYSELVQETIAGLPLLINPKPVEFNIDKCNYNAQQLIVGGQNASLGEFPHMAAVGFTDEGSKTIQWNCGGSLISENFVLTAAHCTTSALGAPSMVRLGDHDLKRGDDGAHPVQLYVRQVIRHEDYRPNSRYNDIALLRLSRPVTFTPHIRPACLYQRPTFNTGKTVATGWGRMAYHEEQSDVLLKVVISIIDNEQCNRLYRVESSTQLLNRGIIDEQMCAGELTGGKDTCQGDSGGPIEVTSIGNQCIHHIVGVTSFGKKCGQPNAPGVYTRVSAYVKWIEKVVWPQSQ